MKLFQSKQIADIDLFTISHEPIASIDLMERASQMLCNEFVNSFKSNQKLIFFIGPGNNGGDGLALARMLADNDFLCVVYIVKISNKLSANCELNLKRLHAQKGVKIKEIKNNKDFPKIQEKDVIVDALFGSGLSRPVDGLAAEVIKWVNKSLAKVVAIDIPSGLFGDDNAVNNHENIIKADFTYSLQFPKISFMFAENEQFVGLWKVLPIGLNEKIISETESNYFYLTSNFIGNKVKKRVTFAHKGSFGHAMLVAGSYGKMGAAILGAKSCLRSGVGLLTVHLPKSGYQIIQIAVPEAMVSADDSEKNISLLPEINNYSAIGIGPGIGIQKQTKDFFKNILLQIEVPLVIDADALNIFSANKLMLKLLPKQTVLTPHPGEFDRLAGKSINGWERHLKQIEFAKKYQIVIVLKGAHTSIAMPDGRCFFNATGNPGMATAGSGDVLTGIILSLLAQGYSSEDASLVGVYLHGLAGDFAKLKHGEESLIAGDIIENIGCAFLSVKRQVRNDDEMMG